jgi:hypothetical protein
MNVIFERGDREAPVGHALIYFRADDRILATYVIAPPIEFNLTKYLPAPFAGAMQGMDLGDAMVSFPMPPILEEVGSFEYLQALASRRQDDLVYAGATMLSDPMRLMADAAEAAREYGELYRGSALPRAEEPSSPEVAPADPDAARFGEMSERERLNELTRLTGRLRDSLRNDGADPEVERQMQQLADLLPAKYRAYELVNAAGIPGERGQQLAALYLERCYKLYNEEYLDLERIDREIAAIGD